MWQPSLYPHWNWVGMYLLKMEVTCQIRWRHAPFISPSVFIPSCHTIILLLLANGHGHHSCFQSFTVTTVYRLALRRLYPAADQQISLCCGPLSYIGFFQELGGALAMCSHGCTSLKKIHYKWDIFSYCCLRLFSFSVPTSPTCSSCWSGVSIKWWTLGAVAKEKPRWEYV